jgi:hypothetical protein
MKIIAFCILIAFSSTTLFAQKCKYDVERKDPFTGKTTQGFGCQLQKTWRIGLSKTDTVYSIDLLITFPGDVRVGISKGDTLMIALDNDKPLVLLATVDVAPTSDVVSNGYSAAVLSYCNPFYGVTKDDIVRLSENKVTAVKVYLGNSSYAIDIPEKMPSG